MGTSNSRRMDESDGIHVGDDDPDTDIAQVLQYLIRSGQVHIIGSDNSRDSSDDENELVPPSPPKAHEINTETLDKSEFKFLTRQAAGLATKVGHERPRHLVRLMSARERGMPGTVSFTRTDQRHLMNRMLPNSKDIADSQHSKIFCGSFSRDGQTLLTASQDKKIRLYDSSRIPIKLKTTIIGRNVGWSILDTAFSPDGKYIAYSSWSESIHLCPIDGGKDQHDSLLLCPYDRRFCIFSLTFSSDGNEILCGANDGCIYIYDRGSNRRQLRILSHDDDVNTVAFADETSQIVYSGGDDGIVKVWDRRTLSEAGPVPVGLLAGHMDGITFIESRGDGRHLLSNSKDQSIKLWDIRYFSSQEAVRKTRKAVSGQSWDYRWQCIPRGLKNPRVKITGDSSIMTYCGHSVLQTLIRCHFSPVTTTGQRYIYTGCATGHIVVYDALTGKIVRALGGHRACVRDVSWHPFRPEIVSTSWDGNMCLWTYKESELERMDVEIEEERAQCAGTVRRSLRIMERNNRMLRSGGTRRVTFEDRKNV